MSPKWQLYIRNPVDRIRFKEEYICEIVIRFAEGDAKFPGSTPEERLIIAGYTRDPRILNHNLSPVTDLAAHFNEVNKWPTDYTDPNSALREMLIQFAVPQFQMKFSGFANYLKDRNKAAVISYVNATTNYSWYLLPPKQPDAQTLIGLYEISPPSPPPPPPLVVPQSVVQSTTTNIPIAPSLTVPESQQVHSSSNHNHNHHKFNGHTASANSRHSSKLSSQQEVPLATDEAGENWRKSFNQTVRERLLPFIPIDGKKPIDSLEFEPMTKTERSIVHKVVTENEELLSCSIGTFDERRVLVYRKGHAPTDHMPENLLSKVKASVDTGGLPARKTDEVIYPPRNDTDDSKADDVIYPPRNIPAVDNGDDKSNNGMSPKHSNKRKSLC